MMDGRGIIRSVCCGIFMLFGACCCNAQNTELEMGEKQLLQLADCQKGMGVNYNEQLQFVNFNDLERTQTEWVRGFMDFFQLYENAASLKTDKNVVNYLQLKLHGYLTILNIKWNFKLRSEVFPADGSAIMESYFAFLDQLLELVWQQTDMLVIGNEPFIETPANQKNEALVNFYKSLAARIEKFQARHAGHTVPLFVGAFNNLEDMNWRTEAVKSLMTFVKENPAMAGIDLHIHHATMDQMKEALRYAAANIRGDQKILITEFSLVKHWKSQLNGTIPGSFASKYGYLPTMKNYQYIDLALKQARQSAEWFDFLQSSYWFESQKHYLQEAFSQMLAEPRFLLAMYAIRQSYPYNHDFTPETTPWVLNGLFANRTIVPDSLSGQNQFNYSFIHDFISIQNKTAR